MLLFTVFAMRVGVCAGSLFCDVDISNIAIIVLRKRELITLCHSALVVVWLSVFVSLSRGIVGW